MASRPTSQPKGFIPAPGVAQVEMVYLSTGQICENVFHVLVNSGGGPVTETQMDTLHSTFESWEASQGRQLRNASCTLITVRVRDLGTQSGLVKEYTPTGNVTGTGPGQPCPGNVTLAIRWSTGRGGRSYRGRTYFIGLSNNLTTGNQVNQAAQAQISTTYAALQTAVEANAGFKMAVVSYSQNKFWRATAAVTPITSVSVDPNIDSQRRRLAGRGT